MKIKKWIVEFDFGLLVLLFLSITVLPVIRISGLPAIGIEELLMPIILFRIFKLKLFKPTIYTIVILSFTAYILLTIFVNKRYASLQDYFEIYKMGKFLMVLLFSQHVFKMYQKEFIVLLKLVFSYLLVFNLLHYFNVFRFNEIVMPYFSLSEIHLAYFGLDSLGNPAGKRMIGTMSNPNVNAIFFLFFYTFFLVLYGKNGTLKQQLWFYLPFMCVLLTQSRTGFISLSVLTLFWFIYNQYSLKKMGVSLLFFALFIGIAYLLNAYSLVYYTKSNFNVMQNTSMLGRYEVWQHLLEMIIQKPFLGYGPNKNYFYENRLHAENEYILYQWRYGIFGLLFYFSWILTPLKKLNLKFKENSQLILFVIVILVNSITNLPLSNPVLLLMFAISVGYYFALNELKEKELENV